MPATILGANVLTSPDQQLKRAHSADPDSSTPETSQLGSNSDTPGEVGTATSQPIPTPGGGSHAADKTASDAIVGSPLKKARPSVDQGSAADKYSATQSLSAALGSAMTGSSSTTPNSNPTENNPKIEEEEEL